MRAFAPKGQNDQSAVCNDDMRNADEYKTSVILSVCGIVPVVWLALLIAPYVSGGLLEIIENLSIAMNEPFQITVCENSVKTVLIFLLCYGMGIGVYLSTRRNYRKREEHGSAKWGNAGTVNKKYRNKNPSDNKLLTQNVRIGLDGRKHRRNLNIMVVGGSGAGKTRFFAKPNMMQAYNQSYVCLDPKGEILRDVGNLLEEKASNCKVLQIHNPILTNIDLMKIKEMKVAGFKVETIPILYYKNTSLEKAIDHLFVETDRAYREGANILILSDRGVDENHVAIPSLLAVSALQQHLVETKKRTHLALVLETAEPREVHHFATLLGYGASAINP